jgi:hypothetical protein
MVLAQYDRALGVLVFLVTRTNSSPACVVRLICGAVVVNTLQAAITRDVGRVLAGITLQVGASCKDPNSQVWSQYVGYMVILLSCCVDFELLIG